MLGADEEELYQHPAASQTPAKGPLLVMGNVLPSFPTTHLAIHAASSLCPAAVMRGVWIIRERACPREVTETSDSVLLLLKTCAMSRKLSLIGIMPLWSLQKHLSCSYPRPFLAITLKLQKSWKQHLLASGKTFT